MDELIQKLLNNTLSPYEFIDIVKDNSGHFGSFLKQVGLFHSSPYIRLCSAWALGELRDKTAFTTLQRLFVLERENNARANIVWALFMINQKHITLPLFKKFLIDPYYLVTLIALKNITGLYWVEGKLDFTDLYNSNGNLLVKLELLRNIRSFKLQNNINQLLKHELLKTSNTFLKVSLIRAISMTKQVDSLDVLIDYYHHNKKEFQRDETLTYNFVSAIFFMYQSKPYPILFELYNNHKSLLIRWKIVETLASVGGPKCLDILTHLRDKENNEVLKKQMNDFIRNMFITVN